ncbi:hypothetical protein GSI_09635 [Ganoderma sinense ZZ0214-1]|uniref:Uncharacterized protein n=1 Tax=Ganoderma sinense ZZ0214-1 TaxID=1077348 RepID=A0A2G8S364_9APHY|nr:hypothetical protein GSI_09635 [Ganoderma sinense ZZ0214-1]
MPSDSTARESNRSLSPLPAGPPATSSHSSDSTSANDQEPIEHDVPPEVQVPVTAASLQANMKGDPRPGFIDAFAGIVAAQAYTAQGWDSNIVVTSPNADWVPEFAVAHSEITTFADGRWGRHEYSRWPQEFARETFHVHCIPSKPRPDGPREILWRTLDRTDWKPDDCGIPGVGFLDKQLQDDLLQEVESVISCYFRCNDGSAGAGWNKIGVFLTVCLQHTVDRLRSIPAVPGVIISLAAHVQRLTLELSGLIEWLKEVSKRVASVDDYSWMVLDVLGAYTADPSIAQVLYRAGIPVWLQRERNTRIRIYKVVTAMDIPPDFSQIPSYPRLVLAKRDLSGALNLPGEWRTAMAEIVRRQLCASQLPKLLEEEKDAVLPPAKRLREGVAWVGSDSSSVGAAKPVFITRASQHVKALQHDLPPAPPASSSQSAPGLSNPNSTIKRSSRRARARQAKAQSNQGNAFATIPSRQYYASSLLSIAPTWASVLSAVSPLPQPKVSVKYFSAPPWLLDTLVGFEGYPEKTMRYLHHWVSIRAFCRVRLFDATVAGRPLTIAEWRDALWGDYDITDPPEGSSGLSSGRPKLRHELQVNIRRLFGQGGSLPSYHVDASPEFGNTLVTLEVARSDFMGAIKWRAQELILLEKVAASEDGQKQLKKSHTDCREGRSYWFRNATNLFVMKYREAFSGCFEEESDIEFAYRQQRQRYAKLEQYPKETEVERDERLNTRIESWLKSQSGGRNSRRKQSDQPPPSTEQTAVYANVPSPTYASASTNMLGPTASAPAVSFVSTHTFAGTSDMVLGANPNAHAVIAPFPAPAAHLAPIPGSVVPTDEQLHKVLNILKEIQMTLLKDRGWVGWCLLGGLDGRGKLGNFDHCTAYDCAGVSFEEFLASKLGVTVDGLLAIFENFVGSSFGLPARPLEARTLDRVDAGLALGGLSGRDECTHPASTLAHTSPSASASVSTSWSPPAPTFETPVKTFASLSSSPLPFPPECSPDILAMVTADLWTPSSGTHMSHTLLTPAKSTIGQPQADRDSPRVVFGSPPPRVLTTAPEMPHVKKRRSRPAVARTRTSRKSGSSAVEKTSLERLRDTVSPALGRGKRQRISTAKALDQSPDMSAANKLRRRADEALRATTEAVKQPEASEGQVKRRRC